MKKKRIVKLEPQTVELFAEVLSKLRPPPPLTVSQWADRYRVLSAESSAEPGRWHTEKAPYQRAIMDAIGDPHVRSVVVMSAAQIGKTDAFILNPLGYYMDYAPCPVMCMQPTLDMGQTLSKDRIAPMIRDTPRLTGLVDTKSRYAGNTVMKKNFPGGHITIVGANSPSSLASRPIKVLLADEIDRYPKSAGTEGDPLDLAKKRQTTFWDYKTVMVSTPTIKGDSRIEDAYLLSTQEEWNVPCPECGASSMQKKSSVAARAQKRKLTSLPYCVGIPPTGWTGRSMSGRWTGSCRSCSTSPRRSSKITWKRNPQKPLLWPISVTWGRTSVMTDEELEHRLTAVENRAQSNTHRLDELGKLTDAVNGMNTNIKLTIQQLETTNRSLEVVTAQNKKQDDRLTALEKAPGVFGNKLWWAVIAALIAGFVASELARYLH